jgi:hypothetical protein
MRMYDFKVLHHAHQMSRYDGVRYYKATKVSCSEDCRTKTGDDREYWPTFADCLCINMLACLRR